MKKLTFGFFTLIAVLLLQSTSFAQMSDGSKKFKQHINKIVQKVEEADSPSQKRAILNESFDDLITVFERIEKMKEISENDLEAIGELKKNIKEKKDELNGTNGFARVENNQLDRFAQYVQQDLEQADKTITISLTVALLIVIILLLL